MALTDLLLNAPAGRGVKERWQRRERTSSVAYHWRFYRELRNNNTRWAI